MRKTIALLLAFFLFPVSFPLADTLVRIPNAELSIPFGAVKGEILLAGSYLVFIDEEKPELSFVIPRGILQDLSSKDDVLTFHLNKSIRDRSGERASLIFRLAEKTDIGVIGQWSEKSFVTQANAAAGKSEPALLTRDTKAAHASASDTVKIPADTVFRLRMGQGISSRTAQKGDTFTTNVMAPVVIGDVVAVPEGSVVRGRITEVTRAERRSNGAIAVAFYELELPTNRKAEIYGSLTSLDNVKGERREVGPEGEVEGKSTTKRDVVFIGGGAGVGAAIGAVTGGGKGAGIGAAIGAGLGTLGTLLSEGNEVEVASGTDIVMALDREVNLPLPR